MLLIVEDTAEDKALTLRALKNVNVQVPIVAARDGPSAFDMFGILSDSGLEAPLPSLMLLDYQLPCLNAPEVLGTFAFTCEPFKLPVVVIKTSDEPRDIDSAVAAGNYRICGQVN